MQGSKLVNSYLKKSAATLAAIACFSSVSFAGDLIYTPQNPSFGGSVANGSFLLGLAGAQKLFEKERDEDSNLERFNDRLQSSILSRITSAVTRDIVDVDGNILPGLFETADYVIEVTDNEDGTLTIQTTDKDSGETTLLVIQNVSGS